MVEKLEWRCERKREKKESFFLMIRRTPRCTLFPYTTLFRSIRNVEVGDGIFNLNQSEKDKLKLTNKEKALVKPFYTTSELHRYYGNPINKLWIIYTTSKFKNEFEIESYPNIKVHLDKFKRVFTSDNKPYGLHRSREEKFFKGEKIFSLRKCSHRPSFTYTNFDAYVNRTFIIVKTKRVNQKYLTALLNSKVVAFWLRYKGKMQGNNYQIDKEPLVNIPIVKIDNTATFEILVDYILYLKTPSNPNLSEQANNEHIALFFEDVIDGCVFELYFEEHMKECNINILDLVTEQLTPIKNKDKKEAGEIILSVWQKLRKSKIAERMRLFTVKSPDILKLIFQG